MGSHPMAPRKSPRGGFEDELYRMGHQISGVWSSNLARFWQLCPIRPQEILIIAIISIDYSMLAGGRL
jgi:hypothetical protein